MRTALTKKTAKIGRFRSSLFFCALFLLFPCAFFAGGTVAQAAETQQDIEISAAVTPKDTATYVMRVSTVNGHPVLMLDTRGLPATVTPQKAWHMLPESMLLGKYLPLIRPTRGGQVTDPWTLKVYWGCSKEVPKDQPLVVPPNDKEKQKKLYNLHGEGSASSLWRTPPTGWGWGEWPNSERIVQIPAGASLKGDHFVHGNYLPHIKFNIAKHDFMAPFEASVGGDINVPIAVTWKSVPGALGYFVFATASNNEKKELVVWTSSQKATRGLLSHEYAGRINELIRAGVVLKPDTFECYIPAGILAGYQNPMITVYAWGEDYHVSHPERPAKPPKGWRPDWSVRGLFLSQWTGIPGGSSQPSTAPSEEVEKEKKDGSTEQGANEDESNKKKDASSGVIKKLF